MAKSESTHETAKRFERKITVRTCGITPETLDKVADKFGNEEVSILKVYGQVSEMKADTGDLGPYIRFAGDFQAESALDGSRTRSKNMILPEMAEVFLQSEVQKAKAEDPKASMQFGLDVTVKATNSKSKNISKYQFGVKPLTNFGGQDLLDRMGDELGGTKTLELQ